MSKWIYDHTDVVCPHCKTAFNDEIFYIRTGEYVIPKYCPECGRRIANPDEEVENNEK